ncbi:MAG TPA: type II toxin-antitoxin system VapC family toxin [Chloroflexi bacterium]|nr:type II toxin-antitoxin system VapC family toxin [Chloroflexota bacterium]
MTSSPFLDANVILRYLLNDLPAQADRAEALFVRVQRGEARVYLPEIALADVVWTLHRFYKRSREEIRSALLPFLGLEGLEMRDRATAIQALHLFADRNIDFSDALIAAEMLQTGQAEIYSYDRDFDRIAGIRRVEP